MLRSSRPAPRRLARTCLAAGLAVLLLPTSTRAQREILSEVVHTMMHSLAGDATFGAFLAGGLGQTVGGVAFTTTVDPLARSFSYATLPGQTFAGQAFALSTTAVFNSAADRYEWTGTGQVGETRWTTSGVAAWTASTARVGVVGNDLCAENPPDLPKGEVSVVVVREDGRYVWGEHLQVYGPAESCSRSTLTLFEVVPPGNQLRPIHEGVFRDQWNWDVGAYVITGPWVRLSGVLQSVPGQEPRRSGDVSAEFAVVPEPSSLLLFAAGGALMIAARRRPNLRSECLTRVT